MNPCGPALGAALIKFFGFVPEAWKAHPAVSTQCPDQNKLVPGTCIRLNPEALLCPALPG